MNTATAHHGTHHDTLPLVSGLCLATDPNDDGYAAASAYAKRCDGEFVFEVSIDMTDLIVREVEVDRASILNNEDYPGDHQSERDALVADGVDILAFNDAVCGIEHRTLRLISDRALAAVTVTGAYDPD